MIVFWSLPLFILVNLTYINFSWTLFSTFFGTGIGGDSRATVLVCASPENENAVETLQALRFGELWFQKSCLNYHEIFYTSQSYILMNFS